MMKKLNFFFLLLISSVVFGQGKTGIGINQMLFPVGFDIENLTSFGFSNSVKSDLSGLSSSNPALITDFKKVSGSLSFSLPSSNREYLYGDIGIEKYKPYIPNNFTVMLPFEKYFIAASYNQRYFSQLDFGNIAVTSETQPDGTGETYSPDFYQLVNQYSLVLGMLNEKEDLSFAINLNLNHLIFYQQIVRTTMDFDQIKPSFSVGITYKLNEHYKLTSFYSHKVVFTGMTKFEGSNLLLTSSGGTRGGQLYQIDAAEFDINQKIPAKFSAGLIVTESELFDYYFQYSREFWKGTVDRYPDVHHYSSGLIYGIGENLTLSAGFNYLYQKFDPNEIFDGNMSALYLNFGSTFYLDQFNFSASLADSHISNSISSDITSYRRKQTLFKLAVGYAL